MIPSNMQTGLKDILGKVMDSKMKHRMEDEVDMLVSGDKEHVTSELEKCEAEYDKYLEKKGYRWITMIVSAVLWGILGYYMTTKVAIKLLKSQYDRSGMNALAKELMGDHLLTSATSQEILMTSYEINKQEPRIFTKWAAKQDPTTYNVKLGDAASASGSAPIYFNPKVIGD